MASDTGGGGPDPNKNPPWISVISAQKRRRIDEIITTSNQYSPLQVEPTADETMVTDQPNNNNSASDNTPHVDAPPAFYIEDNVNSVEGMITSFHKLTGNKSFVYKCVPNFIKINAKTIQTYTTLRKFCKDNKLNHYTHQLKTQRAFKAVIKDLHHTYPISSLMEELQQKGHNVRRINKIWNKSTREPCNMFMVELEPAENNKEIYELIYIDHCVVKVVAPIKRWDDIPQCHGCQAFGHTKNYCNMEPNCVKCGGDHATSRCSMAKNSTPKCVNCEGAHTANYKGCPTYQERIRRLARPAAEQQQQRQNYGYTPRRQDFPPTGRGEFSPENVSNAQHQTYAQATAGGTEQLLKRIDQLMEMMTNLFTVITNLLSQSSQK